MVIHVLKRCSEASKSRNGTNDSFGVSTGRRVRVPRIMVAILRVPSISLGVCHGPVLRKVYVA